MEQAKGIILSAIDALTEKLEESEIDAAQESYLLSNQIKEEPL